MGRERVGDGRERVEDGRESVEDGRERVEEGRERLEEGRDADSTPRCHQKNSKCPTDLHLSSHNCHGAQIFSNRWTHSVKSCQSCCNITQCQTAKGPLSCKSKIKLRGGPPALLVIVYLILSLPLPSCSADPPLHPEDRSAGHLRPPHGGFQRRQGFPDRLPRGNPRLGILERGPLTLINGKLRPILDEAPPRPQPSIKRNFFQQNQQQRPIDRRIDQLRPQEQWPLIDRPLNDREPEIFLTGLPTASQDFDPASQEFGQFEEPPADQDRAASIQQPERSKGRNIL